MRKPIIVIKVYDRDYMGLVNLGAVVLRGMTDNSYFPDPSPSLPVLRAAVTDVMLAVTTWDNAGNRGSQALLFDLRGKTMHLSQLLKAMSQYVQNAAQLLAGTNYPLMTVILSSSGFNLRKTNSPQGILQPVRNFHRMVAYTLRENEAMLKWAKPADVGSYSSIKLYKVYKGSTAVFAEAAIIAASSKTSFKDENTSSSAVTWFYWIVPVGTAGDGVPSNPLQVKFVGA